MMMTIYLFIYLGSPILGRVTATGLLIRSSIDPTGGGGTLGIPGWGCTAGTLNLYQS